MTDAILMHKEADMIVHLGDGERDIDKIRDIIGTTPLVQVCGNCDFASLLPANELVTLASTRIFCTHGHTELVKHGTQALYSKARVLGARIALYGHTHESVTDYCDGLYVMNPGSARYGEYGAIDITPSGIMLLKMNL
jgi:putative phosphoesterase